MRRVVHRETLDDLAADDPAAVAARADLRRVHRAMGSAAILGRVLPRLLPPGAPGGTARVLEIGSGDGTLMLRVAQRGALHRKQVEFTLLDRQPLLTPQTVAGYARCGWRAQALTIDIGDWIHGNRASDTSASWDLIVANLFLHHFADAQLQALLAVLAARTERLLACEPRRGWFALGASHLIGALGVGRVTRRDAVLSVQAGFRAHELGDAWPSAQGSWSLEEGTAGLFSHLFIAQRTAGAGQRGAP